MAKITDKLAKLSVDHLGPEEKIISGVRVSLKGTALGAGISALGTIGHLVADPIFKEGHDQAKEANIPFAQQMALGLTSSRIILWKRSPLSGAPKNIIGELPVSSIKSLICESGKLSDFMTLTLADGQELQLESVKIDKGAEFAEAFQALNS